MNFDTWTRTIYTKIKNNERKPSIYKSLFKPLPVSMPSDFPDFLSVDHKLFAFTEEFFICNFHYCYIK